MNIKKNKPGSALLLTMFLISGIIVVAFGGSYLMISGLRSSGLQYDSSRAYYVAESGAEYALDQVRKRGFDLNATARDDLFPDTVMPDAYAGSFVVDYKRFNPIILISTGSYGVTKRSVELNF
jgi:hypothetical protein